MSRNHPSVLYFRCNTRQFITSQGSSIGRQLGWMAGQPSPLFVLGVKQKSLKFKRRRCRAIKILGKYFVSEIFIFFPIGLPKKIYFLPLCVALFTTTAIITVISITISVPSKNCSHPDDSPRKYSPSEPGDKSRRGRNFKSPPIKCKECRQI